MSAGEGAWRCLRPNSQPLRRREPGVLGLEAGSEVLALQVLHHHERRPIKGREVEVDDLSDVGIAQRAGGLGLLGETAPNET